MKKSENKIWYSIFEYGLLQVKIYKDSNASEKNFYKSQYGFVCTTSNKQEAKKIVSEILNNHQKIFNKEMKRQSLIAEKALS